MLLVLWFFIQCGKPYKLFLTKILMPFVSSTVFNISHSFVQAAVSSILYSELTVVVFKGVS